MKLWVDDERPMPSGFDMATSDPTRAIELIHSGVVTEISLDHDLGDQVESGYSIAKFIEENANDLQPMILKVHSMNPVGRANILAAFKKAEEIWEENRPSCPYCFTPMIVDGREYLCLTCNYSV